MDTRKAEEADTLKVPVNEDVSTPSEAQAATIFNIFRVPQEPRIRRPVPKRGFAPPHLCQPCFVCASGKEWFRLSYDSYVWIHFSDDGQPVEWLS